MKIEAKICPHCYSFGKVKITLTSYSILGKFNRINCHIPKSAGCLLEKYVN